MILLDRNLDNMTRDELSTLRTAIDARRREIRRELEDADRLKIENCSRARRHGVTHADLTRRLRAESMRSELDRLGHECLRVQDALTARKREAHAEFFDAYERHFIAEAKRKLEPGVFNAISSAANLASRHEGAR